MGVCPPSLTHVIVLHPGFLEAGSQATPAALAKELEAHKFVTVSWYPFDSVIDFRSNFVKGRISRWGNGRLPIGFGVVIRLRIRRNKIRPGDLPFQCALQSQN